jgi:hypothetical protein
MYVVGSPKYLLLFFVKRENQESCFAQKTVKNKRSKLLRKGKYKVYFPKKIRRSSPKYSIKLSVNTFWLNNCRFVLYQLFG